MTDIDKARADFTRAVLGWTCDQDLEGSEESDEIVLLAGLAGLMKKVYTPDDPEGHDWEYRLTELGEQAAASIQ